MSDKHTYELYGGPLDGAVVTLNRKVEEKANVEFDLCRNEILEGTTTMISKPCGTAAVHFMSGGRLEFLGMKELNQT